MFAIKEKLDSHCKQIAWIVKMLIEKLLLVSVNEKIYTLALNAKLHLIIF